MSAENTGEIRIYNRASEEVIFKNVYTFLHGCAEDRFKLFIDESKRGITHFFDNCIEVPENTLSLQAKCSRYEV